MPQRIDLVLQPEEAASEETWKQLASRKVRISLTDISRFEVLKKSIDARSKNVKVILQLNIFTRNEKFIEEKFERQFKNVTNAKPVVIAGSGPAGLFAAIRLIELGYKPVIIERGKDVKSRRRDLAAINRQRIINPDSNYCFGEGGAGTYSDGKLYTRSDKRGNIRVILKTFVSQGADPLILIESHPHIGTNKLPGIIENIRNKITACGGDILFNSRLVDVISDKNKIEKVTIQNTLNNSEISVVTDSLILATGHSARDIFYLLHRRNILIESKPFALGVRIEHPQSIIDQAQYHCETRSSFLPPAPYTFTHNYNGRGIYSFCMCPGGIIAPAATAPGEMVVNGWSPSKRNNPFANSGIVVSIDKSDFDPKGDNDPLRAIKFQQDVEQKSFSAGGSNLSAPAQRMNDFVQNRHSSDLPSCSYIPGIVSADLKSILPDFVTATLQEGLKQFGKKMKGYFTNEAVLVATESRTSSPVRIPRNESLMHVQIKGLFPCGEGAGYAGGIISAAIDGERCAEAAVQYLTS